MINTMLKGDALVLYADFTVGLRGGQQSEHARAFPFVCLANKSRKVVIWLFSPVDSDG
jgi:hypothetical protein